MKVTKNQVHNFVLTTAKRFGLCARTTLNNKTKEDFFVHVVVRRQDGTLLKTAPNVGEVKSGTAAVFDLQELCREMGILQLEYDYEELLFQFSLIPKKYQGQAEPYDIDRAELTQWLYAQDHYIEYYCPRTGYASGVLYNINPMNDQAFFPKASNVVQAPKVILSQTQNTFFHLIHFTSDSNLQRNAQIICVLRKPSGEKVAQWEERLAPYEFIWLDIKERLQKEGVSLESGIGEEGFLYFQAYCRNSSFACLTLNLNEKTNTIGYEHSLAPNYYFPPIKGPRKGEIISYTEKNILNSINSVNQETVSS